MGQYLPGETTRSILKPYGVWAVIAPFNFPLAIAAGMSTGALITGNTVAFKPASDTPYLGLRLAELLGEAGLPPGVFDYVTGPGATVGQELVENPDVDGFVFTGSRAVGLKAFETFTSGRPKPIITEMGGKNPTIVTASAELDKAALGVMRAAFGYGGQKCSACSRVLVDRRVKDAFLAKLVEETEKLKIGDPTVRDVYLGPVINQAAVATYQEAIAEIKSSNGKILAGGQALQGNGHFIEPTIVDGLPRDHRINKEELFVPILSIVPVEGLEDAIRVANDVDYGLTAGIFSREPADVRQFFARVHAGVLYANRTAGATTGAVVGVQPFGGWKLSGISGKSAGGHYYLPQFLREQSQSEYA
jgi:1-pyrroline-5-carboxylate dehydrogenase